MSMRRTLQDESMRRLPPLDPVGSIGFGAANEDAAGRAYNQAAFRYFLDLEQKRAQLAGRTFALLLIDRGGATVAFEPGTASRLFNALRRSLRGTDFLGWYQEGLVMGAVLTHQAEGTATSIERLIEDRFEPGIREALQYDDGSRIHVRVFRPSMSASAVGQSWP